MIYLRRINGNRMSPTLLNGDYIVAFSPLQKRFSVGDIVIVNHPQFSEIIKRIHYIDEQGKFWLIGDGLDTLSTDKMGAIDITQILAKLCWHIKAKEVV